MILADSHRFGKSLMLYFWRVAFLLSTFKAASGDASRSSEESNMFRRLTTLFFISCGLILALAPKAESQDTGDTFEAHVGHGKVNIVDFRRSPNSGGLPLVFRIEFKTFESVPSDGFFGRITSVTSRK